MERPEAAIHLIVGGDSHLIPSAECNSIFESKGERGERLAEHGSTLPRPRLHFHMQIDCKAGGRVERGAALDKVDYLCRKFLRMRPIVGIMNGNKLASRVGKSG